MNLKRWILYTTFLLVGFLSSCEQERTIQQIQTIETLPLIEVRRDVDVSTIELPNTVVVIMDDDTKQTVLVNWNLSSTYDRYNTETILLEGDLNLREFINNPNQLKAIQQITFTPVSLLDTLRVMDAFSTFYEALVYTELIDILATENVLTIFAPNNEAFTNALIELDMTKEELFESDILEDILYNHITVGDSPSSILRASAPSSLISLEGSDLEVSLDGNTLLINGNAQILITDIDTTNGRIHEIDAIVMPDEPITLEDLNITQAELQAVFLEILQETGLFRAILFGRDMTFFMPEPEAFIDILETYNVAIDVLINLDEFSDFVLNHIVSGEYLEVDLYSNAPFTLTTLAGNTLDIEVIEGDLWIGGSMVTAIQTIDRLGLAYTIDDVLLTDELIAVLETLSTETVE